jgi:monovalent cation:H+ antiporter, CPA1 family
MFHRDGMPFVVLILAILLTIGFLGSRIALQLRLPHSVFLVVLGVASGILLRNHYPGLWLATESLNRLFPTLVLYVLLPPLIFESAYSLDLDLLKKDFIPLGALSVVALVLSTALIGTGLHVFFGLHLLACLTFGALISATDPVSVIALFKEVGAPKRLATLIEGESLLNDGTAIVLFRTLLAATTSITIGNRLFFSGILEFFQVAVGGAMVGVLLAIGFSLMIRIVSHSGAAQLGLTVAGAYLTFIVADHVLGVSGVIATMAFGLFLGARARLDLNRDGLAGMKHLWEFLALAANILVFFAVGLIVDTSLLVQSIKYIPLTLTIVYVARALSVAGTIPLVNRLKVAPPISFPYQVVLFWGALRGGLALGLVLILPASFPHRDLFIALAISIVFSTLFFNALSTGQILRLLGLDQLEPGDESLYQRSLQSVHDSVLRSLRAAARAGILSENLIQEGEVARQELSPSPTKEGNEGDAIFSLAALLFVERHKYEIRLQDGIISKEAFKGLSNSIARRLDLLSREGIPAVQQYSFDPDESNRKRSLPIFNLDRSMMARLRVRLESLLTLRLCFEEIQSAGTSSFAIETVTLWSSLVKSQLDNFYKAYPHYVAPLQTLFVAKMIRSHSRSTLRELLESAIINRAVYLKAVDQIEQVYAAAEKSSEQLIRPSPAYLLARIPWLKNLPRVAIRNLAGIARKKVLDPSKALILGGARKRCLYVVVAGIIEGRTQKDSPNAEDNVRLYFTGEALGEGALLFDEPWSETIRPLITTEVLEIESGVFELFLFEYPTARSRIYSKDRPRGNA